ncbi:HVO_0476 family zinc finger protein [Halosimplex aquaticum]|uniref:HVO_0476 family zinc finger protein n=1 Tax=Halosimplex aquaticum TaxID=3026162 RepID=A0ABD5Y511_9EURY|nr:HVO_0476 family zinc finger protein [Halosimplex aquaticum]
MTETTERVAVACPSCSPDLETVHEVLTTGGGHATIRCTECGHTHKDQLESTTEFEREVVVSQGGESFTATADVPEGERLAVGEEFLLDTEEAIMTVRITSLELDGDERVEEADAEEVRTIWTRAVGNVGVNLTLHPSDGRHDETRSMTVQVPGDYEFTVGEEDELGGEEFTVEGIHIRDDAHGYHQEKLDFDGDTAFAKDINRLYARDESSSAWSAW